jgi:hypothetical protein
MFIYKLDKYIKKEIITACPLCNMPMFNHEDCVSISAGGYKCMAHHSCVMEVIPPENDED